MTTSQKAHLPRYASSFVTATYAQYASFLKIEDSLPGGSSRESSLEGILTYLAREARWSRSQALHMGPFTLSSELRVLTTPSVLTISGSP